MKRIYQCAVILGAWMWHNTANAQLVNEKFDKLIVSENFETSSNSYWSTVSNNENLFVIQDGEYILNRKIMVSPYAVVSNYETGYETYRLVTSLKIEKSGTDETAIGLIFNSQPSNKGCYLFELNKFKEYRVRRLDGSTYKLLTGDPKNGGWLKHSAIVEVGMPNLIEIRTSNSNFDLLINNTFVQTLNDNTYASGKVGVVIGQTTKGKVDFLYFFTNNNSYQATHTATETKAQNSNQQTSGGNTDDVDISALAESIIQLKTQINKLKEDNNMLRKTIDAMKGEDNDLEAMKKGYEAQIAVLQNEVSIQKARVDSTIFATKDLAKYRDMIKGDENGDLLITLSKTLKQEREKTVKLTTDNQQLRDSLDMIRTAMKTILGTSGDAVIQKQQAPKSGTSKPTNQVPSPPKQGGNGPHPGTTADKQLINEDDENTASQETDQTQQLLKPKQ
ncbi:MAG: hypothetical protein IPO27_14830 [Bacteroidetes bacterium]|nr:hypothetical protein [Bacteroidota bacterium]